MLEINLKWFVVLLANFLALIFILNVILFKPLLKLFKERDESIRGSLDAAKAMSQRKEDALGDMKKGLSEASQKARETFEALRAEGLEKQRELLSKASAEASKIAGKAKDDLRAESRKARAAMKADVERFSEEIVNKLVKV